MKKLLAPILVFFMVTWGYAQTKKPIVASDLMKIVTTGGIQISPDGTKAITVVTRKAVKNENEYYYTHHLYLLDLTGKDQPVQLTFSDKGDGQPQWSPDGKQIAFVRADEEKSQVWLLPLTGGEAHVLTHAEFGASNPRWSPDGKRILFSSYIPYYAIDAKFPWSYERPGRTQGDEPNFKHLKADEKKKVSSSPDGPLTDVRAWLAKNASEGNPRVLTRLNLQGELNLQPNESFSHLFLIYATGEDKAIQLTSGFQNFTNAEWSPNGKKIICTSKIYTMHPDREHDSDLWVIDTDAKQANLLLHWDGYSVSRGQFSPDGLSISFHANTTNGRFYSQSIIATATATGEKPGLLTSALDRDAGGATWSGDSKTIYFTAQADGDIPLYSIPAKGGTITKIIGNDNGVNDFDVKGDKIVYALTETKNPWEIYSYSLKEKSSKQLTKLNEGWVSERQIITPKEYWLTRPDGTKVQYWVMEPIGKKEGVKYPTILNIHGGPSAMWGPGAFSMWHEYQLENSWGYGVVYCNPRGSGGYGDKFKRANFKDWGTGPAADILASLDEAMKNNSWIDKDQLFVEGGSYAGYMVAWIVGHDNRFKAANAQRGVYELGTFMGEGNAWRLVPEHFGGYPWEKETKQLLDFNSPLTYVNNINTPLLIIHGDQDLRTGPIQSEMLYKSLKILNKPVEYIRYPKEGHELTRSGNPGRMMDHMLRVIEFFERYAKHPN
ncbi:MAG: Acylamino-acid-releasing enzyme [Cytophagales bacterium]|nr:S9 family peptidase [Bacteroidota bacterium]MBS1979896.1 S9 family peptidase [Bacteroidota bacterium]WHZ07360.1 MAG: Acylamino-acid-releasing enzyme [Cytophagales bacterium]